MAQNSKRGWGKKTEDKKWEGKTNLKDGYKQINKQPDKSQTMETYYFLSPL